MATKTATAAATAMTWENGATKWSTSTTGFISSDTAKATKWAATAMKFKCSPMTATTPTTDCNKTLGIMTGGCCYTVVGTGPTKALTSTTKSVAAIISAAWPLNKGTANLCSTEAALAKITGWSTGNVIDAYLKFSGNTKPRSYLAGATTTWTCSGASILAASGATATVLISLM